RELAGLGGDISEFVPAVVEARLRRKLSGSEGV
ncbi:MAG TPA: phosphopantetheine adenylyltransferase, partial [Fibrobacteres bacterium]|nr:phosphopantetheine adenylyltransferase [Fibrobacterota bacterium]